MEHSWTYDLDEGSIRWPGGFIHLSPEQAAIWGLLERNFPRKVALGKMKHAIWPAHTPDVDLPDAPGKVLQVQISKIRYKLHKAKAPMTISFGDSFGYFICGANERQYRGGLRPISFGEFIRRKWAVWRGAL